MLLQEFFDSIYVPLKLRGRSQETVRLYRLSLRSLEKTLCRPATLEDLTDLTLARHLSRVSAAGRAAATVNKDRAQLLAIWRFACQRGYLTIWPNVPAEIEPKRTPQAWLPEELASIEKAIRTEDGYIGQIPAKIFWSALFLTILDTAERIGAVMQMEWSQIQQDWITVPAEHRKGKRRDRQYKLSPETIEAINQLPKVSKKVFPWPMNRFFLWAKWGNILKRAGLDADRKSKFHRLRRTVASACDAVELDPQAVLDHKDRSVTEMYLDPRITKQISAAGVAISYMRNSSKDD